MRKIFSFLVATVDGYFEGPNQEFDWPIVDEEFNEFALQQLEETDTLMFGRVTYQGMAGYWPTPAAQEDDPKVHGEAEQPLQDRRLANARQGRVGQHAARQGRRRRGGHQAQAAARQDIAILGSSALTVSLLQLRLVDELRIMVNPIVLGDGKSLFSTADGRIGLKLLKTRPFSSGNVLLYYQPAAR